MWIIGSSIFDDWPTLNFYTNKSLHLMSSNKRKSCGLQLPPGLGYFTCGLIYAVYELILWGLKAVSQHKCSIITAPPFCLYIAALLTWKSTLAFSHNFVERHGNLFQLNKQCPDTVWPYLYIILVISPFRHNLILLTQLVWNKISFLTVQLYQGFSPLQTHKLTSGIP